ncbi:NAD-dependent epimerase/dehydratase family protein [Rhodovulum adriaticum]|uniref:UDP-glucose 4-epimerase n=1 Tax=Rhodovulum adriaticum TaxID=35804 RepID=A0A4R2NZM7_RHOAD|nr:NAD-dependent epimerase/dehydratase family protein [Rhodovulum adriaticum]TCP27218.1 NAD-dependent epimerase/dehydratase family protein [Rhodovulum adriaticum]
MAILITGGAGYIGSHVALALLDTGHDVVIADNLSTGLASLVPARATLERADIRDRDRMAQIMRKNGVDTVIHCAGSTVVPDSVRDPLAYYDNNVGGTLGLLHAMQSAGVRRILFSSTAAVYAINGSDPIPESAPLAPASPYGASKLMAERIIQDMAAAGLMDYMILRSISMWPAPIRRAVRASPPRAPRI